MKKMGSLFFIFAGLTGTIFAQDALAQANRFSQALTRAQQILSSEGFQNGAQVPFSSGQLLFAPSLDESQAANSRIQSVFDFKFAEASRFLQGFAAQGPAGACEGVRQAMQVAAPPGAATGPDARSVDIQYFSQNSATRTCWQNAANSAMSSELRQVFFVPKQGGVDAQSVFDAVSRFERFPNQTARFHFYEYRDPNQPNAGVVARVNTTLPEDPIPLNRSTKIKKCLTIFNGEKYCNTVVHRAYSLGENAYLLTAHLVNLANGDIRFTADAYGDNSNLASLNQNTANGYSAFYIVVDQGTSIGVYNIGLQYLQGACQGSFRRNLLKDGHLKEFEALRKFVNDETGVAPQTCAR